MTHPDDGALLRFLDGQLLLGEAEDVRDHLATCTSCIDRAEEIRRTLRDVAAALQDADAAPRHEGMRNIKWLAAAALVLLAIATAVAPVRAWFLNRTHELWDALVASDSTALVDETPEVETATASVSFVPSTSAFILEVTTLQADGSLTVEIINDSVATASISRNLQSEELLVLPGGLRIINSPSSSAAYVIQLPASLSQIEVIVAGNEPSILDLSGTRRRWLVPINKR